MLHDSCTIDIRGLPNMYTLGPFRALGVYIRQTTCAHVTSISIVSILKYKAGLNMQNLNA